MENQRIRLSKAMLKDALLQLLEEKPLEKITVYEICAAAHINRTTFYKYYGSPADLLDEIVKEVFDNLEQALDLLDLSKQDRDNPDALCDAVEYVYDHRRTFTTLINSISDQVFSDRLFHIPQVEALLDVTASYTATDAWKDYIKLFTFQGGYAVIRAWLNRDCQESPKEIARLIALLGQQIIRADVL